MHCNILYKKKYKVLKNSKYMNIAKDIMFQIGGDAKEDIINLIDTVYNNYSAKLDITNMERMCNFNDGFNLILDKCDEQFKQQANEYYKERNKMEEKFEQTQLDVLSELKKVFTDPNVSIHKTSSFAAKTYVLGESDIDITICIKSNNIPTDKMADFYKKYGEKYLIPLGYTYKDIMNLTDPRQVYQVFTKALNGIEIEVKIRDYDAFETILKYHEFMNEKLSDEKRKYITYIKFLLSKPTKLPQYNKFKWIMMEFGLFNAGIYDVFGKIGLSD